MRLIVQLSIGFRLNGSSVSVPDDGASLLDALREHLGCKTPKDGCSPQGQCGCCTVWVDGAPRVACVTPVRRVAERAVTTVDGLPEEVRDRWAAAFVATGASQCGFCTPGIVMRLASLEARGAVDSAQVSTALAAHLCRCTGWQTILEAAMSALERRGASGIPGRAGSTPGRDPLRMSWRAQVEGPAFQCSGTATVLGQAGFADDTAPEGSLVAVPARHRENDGGAVQSEPVVAPNLIEARRHSGKVQGRRTTLPVGHPVPLPEGDWVLSLQTTWVEPAYLEPDASWCRPGETPASPLANGGAFGGKRRSSVAAEARHLADAHGQPVRVVWPREEVVRAGPKRPPVAAGIRSDGTGILRVALSPSSEDVAAIARRVATVAPGLAVEAFPVAGPPVSADLRAAGWAEAVALMAGYARRTAAERTEPVEVTAPCGGRARVSFDPEDPERTVSVEVWAGEVLDEVTLRSYCIGAVHQALGWVWSEGIAVDEHGEVKDLTIRSFGILTAKQMPPVAVRIHGDDGWPLNASDAVFAATAAAAWLAEGLAPTWPTRRGGR